MNESLLIYFAFPTAIIIFSSISTNFLRNPIKISLLTFAVFLVVTYAAFNSEFLVYTIVYTFLSYIISWITLRFIKQAMGYENIESIVKNNSQMLKDSINISNSIYENAEDTINDNNSCLYNKNMRRYNRF